MPNYQIVTVDNNNISAYPEVICFINPKHSSHHHKVEWLQQRYHEGLRSKLLFVEGERKAMGFIEYIPGEMAWRGVSADGYMFIHCLWVNSTKHRNQGYGSLLIQDCIDEAEKQNLKGVAVLCSNDAFMAKSAVFLKNGFVVAATAPPTYELLYKPFSDVEAPAFGNWQEELKKYHELHIFYSKQCPWVARFMDEVQPFLKENGIKPTIHELQSASDAQNAPCPYATFSIVLNGKLLADHYISLTRFKNIIKKGVRC